MAKLSVLMAKHGKTLTLRLARGIAAFLVDSRWLNYWPRSAVWAIT
jgi:hypothetical protein